MQTQKSTFTAKFSPISSLEVIFFTLILCWGRATASHSGEYWPCFNFQHHNCTACWEKARIFGSVCSLEWPFLQFHEQGAKFANKVDHLTRFFKKVDSQLPSRVMMLIRQPTKDEKWLWTYLKSRIHHIWAFIAIPRSKMTMSQWCFQ